MLVPVKYQRLMDFETFDDYDLSGFTHKYCTSAPFTAELKAEVIARMPIPNPHHDPERAAEWWSMRTGEPVDSDSRTRFPPTEKDL